MDILEVGTTLVITADKDDRKHLATTAAYADEQGCGSFGSDATMIDQLGDLLANSEYDWVDPSETGDLTSAPMLGIREEDGSVIKRWAFMDYQVRCVLEDLVDKGECIFVSGA